MEKHEWDSILQEKMAQHQYDMYSRQHQMMGNNLTAAQAHGLQGGPWVPWPGGSGTNYAPADAPAELYALAENAIEVAKNRDIEENNVSICMHLNTVRGLINESFSEKQAGSLLKKVDDAILATKRTRVRIKLTEFLTGTGK